MVFLAVRKFLIQIPIFIKHVTIEKQVSKAYNHDAFFQSLHINIKSYFEILKVFQQIFFSFSFVTFAQELS